MHEKLCHAAHTLPLSFGMGGYQLLSECIEVSGEPFYVLAAGKRLAIDASNWLHELGSTLAIDIVIKVSLDSLVNIWQHRCRTFMKHATVPVFCFDGVPNPAKMHTDTGRSLKRAANRSRALSMHASGQPLELVTPVAAKGFASTPGVCVCVCVCVWMCVCVL